MLTAETVRRTGVTAARRCISLLVLVVVLLQALPVAFQPEPPGCQPDTKVTPVFTPLRFCEDAATPAGFLSHSPWIVPPPIPRPVVAFRVCHPDPSRDACRDGFPPPLRRPPRISPAGA